MPTLGTILFFTREAFSSYHSLQVLFRSRLKDRAQIQAAYTWSHSISNVELDDSTSGTAGNVVTALFSDKDNPSLDKGNSNINRPHIFTANAIFFLPKLANSGAFARQALGGWEFSLITTAETGASNTVFNTGVSDAGGGSLNNLSGTGYGANQRPNIVPGVPCKLGNKQQVFNPNAFTLNGFKIGTIGNEPRGYCVGPGTVNADLGVYKNWPVGERLKVQFRLEMFNAFNHANFKGVGNSNLNTTWGSVPVRCGTAPCSPTNNVITSSANDNPNPVNGFGTSVRSRGPREIQYTLRFTF